jgi:hypothetical protein
MRRCKLRKGRSAKIQEATERKDVTHREKVEARDLVKVPNSSTDHAKSLAKLANSAANLAHLSAKVAHSPAKVAHSPTKFAH